MAAVDPDGPAGPFTFSLVNDGTHNADNAKFTIAGNTLKTAAELSFDVRTSYTILVRVTDPAGMSFNKEFTVAVVNRR